jgi:starvation-inducible DNA-binding protein
MKAETRKVEMKPMVDEMEEQARVNMGLSEKDRQGVVGVLNTLLSDEYLLYTETRGCHWKVVGPRFNDLHKFFEAQYEALNNIVDEVGERVRSLGGWSLGTLEEVLKHARLVERPSGAAAEEMIANLLADHEAVIRHLRADLETSVQKYHDAGTNNFLMDLMERHEKMAWMLRSFLGGGSV